MIRSTSAGAASRAPTARTVGSTVGALRVRRRWVVRASPGPSDQRWWTAAFVPPVTGSASRRRSPPMSASWNASLTAIVRDGGTEQALGVRLVLGHQDGRSRRGRQPGRAQDGVLGTQRHAPGLVGLRDRRPSVIDAPGPGVAEPERRQQVDLGGFRRAVRDGDADGHVVDGGLGVLDVDIEVAVVIERARVGQLVLGFVLRPPGVLGRPAAHRERPPTGTCSERADSSPSAWRRGRSRPP